MSWCATGSANEQLAHLKTWIDGYRRERSGQGIHPSVDIEAMVICSCPSNSASSRPSASNQISERLGRHPQSHGPRNATPSRRPSSTSRPKSALDPLLADVAPDVRAALLGGNMLSATPDGRPAGGRALKWGLESGDSLVNTLVEGAMVTGYRHAHVTLLPIGVRGRQ